MSDAETSSSEVEILSESDEESTESDDSLDDETLRFNEELNNDQVINEESKYMKLIRQINKPKFGDVTPMVNSAVPFLIDGDSLMLCALNQKSYSLNFGGQFLQVIYYCERILDILTRKGGHVIIVFFDAWKLVWDNNWYLQTCRLSLQNHLKYNTDFTVHKFSTFYSAELLYLIKNIKPRCVFLHLGIHLDVKQLNRNLEAFGETAILNETRALRLFCGEIMIFFKYGLSCIDVDEIEPSVSIISSFLLEPPRNFKASMSEVLEKEIEKDFDEIFKQTVPHVTTTNIHNNKNIRRFVIIIAGREFLKTGKDVASLRLMLLCCAAQEVLKLENRGCLNLELDKKSTNKFQKIILEWHRQLYLVLNCIQSNNFEWNNIGDLWQGTLFSNICSMITTKIIDGKDLGFFQEPYEHLISHITRESSEHIEPYPIEPIDGIIWPKPAILENKTAEQVMMQPVKNALIEQFCGSMFEGVCWANPKEVLALKHFQELRHWHSRKPLTDEYDHIRSTTLERPTTKYELKRYNANATKHSRYMTIYGKNLEGKDIVPEAIICRENESSTSRKDAKIKTGSKKAEEIKARLNQERKKEIYDKELKQLKECKSIMNKGGSLNNHKARLEQIENLSINFSDINVSLEASVIKLQILMSICGLDGENISLEYVKKIFLTIREVLQLDYQLTVKQKKIISSLLYKFGFDEIAQRNNLPVDECDKLLELDWIRYQLQHIGPDLEKDVSEVYDPDIGFTPDLWQTKFINAIRKNESALVVAPTSSGKTFASYYCMKCVLQESSTGIVVYVSPTKALVNQVAATVYNRFSRVKLRVGISVVGVFTRDFKTNALNSRILVTVPQCLDILLLSPRRYSWVKNIRYVIFDEVHNLSGIEGLVWERSLLMIRCPFLALSATISEPTHFHKWLQHIENFKKLQDTDNKSLCANSSYHVELVKLSERHSDLIKYTFGKNGLVHFHPFCSLDDYALDMHDGIPPTVTLSPYETLQLYDAMYSCTNSGKLLPSDVHMEVYFERHCPSGFIKREVVRNYEKELGRVFYDLYKRQKEITKSIVQQLQEDNPSRQFESIRDLLNVMKQKNMLPTLVFSYNRNLVEYLHATAIEGTCKAVQGSQNRTEKISKRTRKLIEKEEKAMAKENRREGEYQKGKMHSGDLRRKSGASYRRRPELPPLNILKNTQSNFKGVGYVDKYDVEFIENRLSKKGLRERDDFIKGFQLGFGYHHAGLNNVMRSSVEMLFRLGVVKVVFATGTLAIGIHMPCKSVVVFGDSPYLNSLEYHQMSGRAGRRGFDIEGNVIFMNVDEKRRDRLITDKLPKMIGNYPISVTLVVRLLLLVNTVTDDNCVSEEATKVTLSRVLTLLQNSLIFQSQPKLTDQIKHFVGFASQLLLIQEIISSDGTPLKLGGLVTHLHYHEPANLAFVYLLRVGALRKLLTTGDDVAVHYCDLITVLSHLFARLKLHKTQLNTEFKNSVVILKPLPDIAREALKQYNAEVEFIFTQYIRSISVSYTKRYGPDDTLPLSNVKIQPEYSYENADDVPDALSTKVKNLCPPRQACSAFIALSGHGDDNLFTQSAINNIRHQICPDINAIPLLHFETELNSYAADFYRHGIKKAIVRDNRLSAGQDFTLLKDFMLVLKAITVSLEELEPRDEKDPVVHHFAHVSNRFQLLFEKAFQMSRD